MDNGIHYKKGYLLIYNHDIDVVKVTLLSQQIGTHLSKILYIVFICSRYRTLSYRLSLGNIEALIDSQSIPPIPKLQISEICPCSWMPPFWHIGASKGCGGTSPCKYSIFFFFFCLSFIIFFCLSLSLLYSLVSFCTAFIITASRHHTPSES